MSLSAVPALQSVAVEGVCKLLDSFETSTHVVLLFEYFGGGNLCERAMGRYRVPEDEAKVIFLQLVKAVEALHELNRVHGELRPDNVVFGAPLHVALVDGGVSGLFAAEDVSRTLLAQPQYAAPELIQRNRDHELSVALAPAQDIWGLGLLLFILLSGSHPFGSRDYDEILHAHVSLDHPRWLAVSWTAKSLVSRLLTRDPLMRPSAKEISADLWLEGISISAKSNAELNRTPPMPRQQLVLEVVEQPEEEEEEEKAFEEEKKTLVRQSSSGSARKRDRSDTSAISAKSKSAKTTEPKHTEASLKKLRVVDLKELLKEKKLSVTGKKADLIARMLQ
jgi:serine/threonine protein kinase